MKKNLKYKKKYIKNSLLYITLFISTLVSIAGIWYLFIDGFFYYCSDKVPFLDLLPPLVHGKNLGDYFIVSPVIVYTLWILALLTIFIVPVYLLKWIMKKKIHTTKILFTSLLVILVVIVSIFTFDIPSITPIPPSTPLIQP